MKKRSKKSSIKQKKGSLQQRVSKLESNLRQLLEALTETYRTRIELPPREKPKEQFKAWESSDGVFVNNALLIETDKPLLDFSDTRSTVDSRVTSRIPDDHEAFPTPWGLRDIGPKLPDNAREARDIILQNEYVKLVPPPEGFEYMLVNKVEILTPSKSIWQRIKNYFKNLGENDVTE